jgi:Glycosyl transferase family 2
LSFDLDMIEPVVCVPARNEAERLPSLLHSLQQQTWLRVNKRPLPTVLVLNNCDDDSRAIVRRVSRDLPGVSLHLIEVQFVPENAHVGSARRLAMDWAFALAPKNSVLLTTDADATPREDWIEANLRAIANGADLVGGYIVGNKQEEALLGRGFVRRAARHLYYAKLVDRLTSLVDPLPHDPWPRHSDHTGASLAVRSEVYAAVGGMRPLRFREDVAFVESVCDAGYRLRHPLDVQVTVSARLDGRAAGGMADCLKSWLAAEECGLPHLVEDPQTINFRLRSRRFHEVDARAVRLRAGEGHVWPPNELTSDGSTAERPLSSIEVELAISRLERMIADNEGQVDVARPSTLDFLQGAG